MIYLVGVVMDIKEAGLTLNVGEERRCNVFALTDSQTEWPTRVSVGARARVTCDVSWEKRGDAYRLKFVAKKIEVK